MSKQTRFPQTMKTEQYVTISPYLHHLSFGVCSSHQEILNICIYEKKYGKCVESATLRISTPINTYQSSTGYAQ